MPWVVDMRAEEYPVTIATFPIPAAGECALQRLLPPGRAVWNPSPAESDARGATNRPDGVFLVYGGIPAV